MVRIELEATIAVVITIFTIAIVAVGALIVIKTKHKQDNPPLTLEQKIEESERTLRTVNKFIESI